MKLGKHGSETPANPSIEQRLFFEGLVSETDPMDYDEATVSSAITWLKNGPPEPFVLFLPLIYPHVPFKVS